MSRPFCRFVLVSVDCPPRYSGMTHSSLLARAGAIALAIGSASPAAAQTIAPMGSGLTSADPAQTLSENLKALARDPYNVDALLQAGFGAIAVGDPNAAFGFFARAEELSPSNARAKAGLGSAVTMMEKPREALRAFDEAIALGMPESAILFDRGLAHDLSGDARKAQKDYLAALKTSSADELTRRLALSLGISGDKDAALSRLDPLIRRNDQAAWRARAFILAMNGDGSGAEKIVRMVAPAGTSASMLSFMQRLADLGPAARARAVHFGTLPANGIGLAMAAESDNFRPVDSSSAARLTAPPPERVSIVPAAPLSAKDARRKAKEEDRLAKLAAKGRLANEKERLTVTPATPPAVAARVAAAMPSAGDKVTVVKGAAGLPLPDALAARSAVGGQGVIVTPKPADAARIAQAPRVPPEPLYEVPAILSKPEAVMPAVQAPVRIPAGALTTDVTPARSTATTPPPPSVVLPSSASITNDTTVASRPAVKPVDLPPAQVAQQQLAAVVPQQVSSAALPSQATIAAASLPSLPETAVPAPAAPPRPALTLADIVQTLELEQESAAAPLPDEAKLRAARLAAQKKAAADDKLKAEKLAEERRLAEEEAQARRNPARIWVQIATGNNRAGLPGTWKRLKDQASKSLARQSAWTVPFRQTNRLLVGPLKSVGDARELVNNLAKEGVQATTFSSDAGQEISRIGGR